MKHDLIGGTVMPKIANYVRFSVPTQGPKYDSGILAIAKLLGYVEEESTIANDISLSIAFEPRMTPRIRKFKEYCEHHGVPYTMTE
ncbi:MAG: hypothetical protein ACI9SY_000618 [Candidatus Paceibacteria bacterium]|jgi:hypothetical protein